MADTQRRRWTLPRNSNDWINVCTVIESPHSDLRLTPLAFVIQIVMKLLVPNLSDSFLVTIACSWRFRANDIQDFQEFRGTRVASVDTDGGKVFCRSMFRLRRANPQSSEQDVIEVNVEAAAERFFGGTPPTVSSEMGDFSSRLHSALNGKQPSYSAGLAGFLIPSQQIAVGSALGSVLTAQREWVQKHGVILPQGTFTFVPDDASDRDGLADMFSFDFHTSDGKSAFAVNVSGHGPAEFTDNCLIETSQRLTGLFERLALAKLAVANVAIEGGSGE